MMRLIVRADRVVRPYRKAGEDHPYTSSKAPDAAVAHRLHLVPRHMEKFVVHADDLHARCPGAAAGGDGIVENGAVRYVHAQQLRRFAVDGGLLFVHAQLLGEVDMLKIGLQPQVSQRRVTVGGNAGGQDGHPLSGGLAR